MQSDEQTTLLVRPDLISEQNTAGTSAISDYDHEGLPAIARRMDLETTEKYDSNPILDKYPVLRFHNVDIKDDGPGHRQSKSLEFDELDKLIKDLKQS